MHKPHITVQQLQLLLAQAEALRLSPRACERLQWFLFFAEHAHSVSRTCEKFGISRATFQRWIERFDPADISTLEERSHHPHTVRQSAVPADVVEMIRTYREKSPQMGKEKIADLLWNEQHILLSASTVGRVIERERLYFDSTPLHWKKRLQADDRSDAAPVSVASVSAAQLPVELAATPAPVVASSCDSCFFCRLRHFNWRAFRRGAFAASVLVNILVLLSLLAGSFWQRQEDTASAKDNASHAPVELHASLSGLTELSKPDAR